jgi:hypothetical protein
LTFHYLAAHTGFVSLVRAFRGALRVMNGPVAIRGVQSHGLSNHAIGPHGHELATAARRALYADAAGLARDAD